MSGTSDGEHDLVALYALDALDDLERARARAHLAGCARCRDELDEVQATLASVADSVAVAPPPALRADVLARIEHIAQVAPAAVPGVAPSASPGRSGRRGGRVPVTGSPRRGVLVALAAAAAVLLVATAGLGWTAARLRADRDTARAQEQALSQVVAAPDALTVDVAGGAEAWRGTRVVVSRSAGEAVLVARHAPGAPSGHTWQLWWLRGGVPVSAGLLGSSADLQVLDGSPGSATAVAITLEPSGGSRAPTTTPVATYTLPA